MIAASEVAASVTSDSVMPPTPEWMTRAATSSVPSASSAWVIASTEPCTSPLMTSGKTFWPVALQLVHHLLERAAGGGRAGQRLVALLADAVVGDLAGAGFGFDDREAVAGLRRVLEAEHLDRRRGAGFLDLLAAVVDEGAHAAPRGAGDDDVADAQRAAAGRARSRPARGPCRAWPR